MTSINTIAGLYVTHSSPESMNEIIDILIDEKLIACANVFPIQSHYFWDNAVVKDDEIVSLLKTSHEKVERCIERIEQLHPYKVPCILQYDIKANKSYYNWVLGVTESTNV